MDGLKDRFKVYLMECYPVNMRDNSTRFIKIGVSKNVKRRLASLQHASPFPLETIFISPVHDHNAKRLEKWLHDHFNKNRLKGEWFCLVEDDIAQAQHFLKDKALINKIEYFRFTANHSQSVKNEWKDKLLDSCFLELIWKNCAENEVSKRDYLFVT